tara:strand:- start:5018 stop:5266 length:249 start_codon:yes stop_codon:yes gene_type:complete
MTIEFIREVLGWCTVINFGILLWWFLWVRLAHDWVYHLQKKWFIKQLSEELFDAFNYAGIGLFKISIILFNLVPYVALSIVE